MKLKIISYNVLEGFSDFYKYECKKIEFHPERLSAAKKLIKEENPDILCLTEALWNVKSYRNFYIDYQKEFNYRYIDIRYSIILLSKYPIIFSKANGSLEQESEGIGLTAKVQIGKRAVNINIIHPKVSSTEKQKTHFVKKLMENQTTPSIILGDFNSISKEDRYSTEWKENFKNKILTDFYYNRKQKEKIIADMLKGKVTKFIQESGFIDTYKEKNKKFDFTIPTDLASKDKSTGIRIDYIFTSPDIKIINSGIIKNKLSEMASDHYPIYAILDI